MQLTLSKKQDFSVNTELGFIPPTSPSVPNGEDLHITSAHMSLDVRSILLDGFHLK